MRLGGAFGALCVALAIVAFSGIHHDRLSDNTDNLAASHLGRPTRSALRQRAKDNVALTARHFYVHDGDLAAVG